MATDISKSILQSQRVQPRKANYATQGSNALQSIDQRPAHKKKHPIVKLPPPRVDRTQEKRKEKVNFDWIKRISLSPNALLVVL
ncbi:MAG: hypothetical protein LBV52_02485, partial [Spirochaetaceae bacterium]|nr:hypothetical protein [Spirochaetaceae bacterium]